MTGSGADTRTRLLLATLKIVGGQGVGAVTNRAVASEAGVALGSLTYHFASQEELLRESLLLFVEEEVARLNAFAEQIGPDPDSASAQLTAQQVAQIFRQPGARAHLAQFDLYVQAARDPGLRDAVGRCYAAYDEVARTMLQALGLPDEDGFAAALVALIDGYELRRLTLGKEPEPPLAELLVGLAEMATATVRA
jgi:DNA-binding transcriptional regulator YbjK